MPALIGAVAGWRRRSTDNGIVLTVQTATSPDQFDRREFDEVSLVLNERQLRSLARDLGRAATERGLELWPRAVPIWKRFFRL